MLPSEEDQIPPTAKDDVKEDVVVEGQAPRPAPEDSEAEVQDSLRGLSEPEARKLKRKRNSEVFTEVAKRRLGSGEAGGSGQPGNLSTHPTEAPSHVESQSMPTSLDCGFDPPLLPDGLPAQTIEDPSPEGPSLPIFPDFEFEPPSQHDAAADRSQTGQPAQSSSSDTESSTPPFNVDPYIELLDFWNGPLIHPSMLKKQYENTFMH